MGIGPERQAEIFKPFVQADDSTTRRFGGTGLGLAICVELASAMGGALTLESVAGQGSTFTLSLPLVEAEPRARVHSPPRVFTEGLSPLVLEALAARLPESELLPLSCATGPIELLLASPLSLGPGRSIDHRIALVKLGDQAGRELARRGRACQVLTLPMRQVRQSGAPALASFSSLHLLPAVQGQGVRARF